LERVNCETDDTTAELATVMEAPLRVEGPIRLTVDAVIGVPSMSAFEKSAVPETVTAAVPDMVPPDCTRVPMVIMEELAFSTPPPVIDTVPMFAEATEFWPPCNDRVRWRRGPTPGRYYLRL